MDTTIAIALVIAASTGCAEVDPAEVASEGDPDRPGRPTGDDEEEQQDDESASGADAGTGEDGAAPVEPIFGTFAEPQLIAALAAPGYDDDDPTVTGDGLEMYFNSDRPAGPGLGDLYVSTRDGNQRPWRAPNLVAGVNTQHQETGPEVSRDGLRLYFSSNRHGGQGGLDIYMCTRPTRSSVWSAPVAVAALNSSSNDVSPVTNVDSTYLVFNSTRDGGDNDLYAVRRDSAAEAWGPPVALATLNTRDSEADAHLSSDGLILYFGSGPAGILDLWRATRPDDTSDFGAPEEMTELNTAANDADPWVAASDNYMVMTSGRSGDNELYESTRVVLE